MTVHFLHAEDYETVFLDLNLKDMKIQMQFKAYLSRNMEITEMNPIRL